jgi:DNA-binding NtrC family response regulator
MGKTITEFDHNAARRLMEYDWPGNVRQLRNVIERAVIYCEKDKITPKELPLLGVIRDFDMVMDGVPSTSEELKRLKKEIRHKAVDKIEKSFVLKALSKNNWNVTRAAQQVGMQRTNFQGLMKKHGITLLRQREPE